MTTFEQKIIFLSLMLNFFMIFGLCILSAAFFYFKDKVTRAGEAVDRKFIEQEKKVQQMYAYILGFDLLTGYGLDQAQTTQASPTKSAKKPSPPLTLFKTEDKKEEKIEKDDPSK